MKIGQPMTIINPKKFNMTQEHEKKQTQPLNRSISLNFLKKSPLKGVKSEREEKDGDFETMLREKELQILNRDNIKRRTVSSIRLKDQLSQKKMPLGQ